MEDENRNFFDPVHMAEERGKIFGKGVSGKFRKTPVTRFGFFLLGAMLLASGGACACVCVELYGAELTSVDIAMMVIFGSMAIGMIACGSFMIKNTFSRSK